MKLIKELCIIKKAFRSGTVLKLQYGTEISIPKNGNEMEIYEWKLQFLEEYDQLIIFLKSFSNNNCSPQSIKNSEILKSMLK